MKLVGVMITTIRISLVESDVFEETTKGQGIIIMIRVINLLSLCLLFSISLFSAVPRVLPTV